MKHIVMFSGGVGSWATAQRVIERHGSEGLTMLFADTMIEDDDLYRFLIESTAQCGGVDASDLAESALRLPSLRQMDERKAALADLRRRAMDRIPWLKWGADGRSPWDVFHDVRYLGNSRIDPCSRVLKRELLREWLEKHCTPEDTTVYLGIDWTEEHRFVKAQKFWVPWHTEAPMIDRPLRTKPDMIRDLAAYGIKPPRLYALGFAHNNCGGYCIKAGLAHFKLLLKTMPETYRFHEEKEAELQSYLEKPVTILRDRRGGKTTPMSMRQFRNGIEKNMAIDELDFGGCGCFTPGEGEEGPVACDVPDDKEAA